tara:strand:+ start:37616 stop:37795 length:180 start_codon:yes stop_codon:yes gene_type:complete
MGKSKEFKEGEEAFLENKILSDNPYNEVEAPDEYLMWNNGFKSLSNPIKRSQLQEDINL